MKSIFFTVLTALVLVLTSCGEDTPTKVNKCKDVTCSGHGTCVVENDTAKCECDNGYVVSGLECITESKCANVTCDDWKTCNETNGSCELKTDRCETTANCSEGKECNTTTHTCVNPVNPCEGVACSGHGACVVENNNPTCDCDEGYHAETLECVIDVVDLCETVNCTDWKSCNPVNGQCELKTGRCDVSGDCLETEECNTTTHTCVNPVNPCEGIACSGHGACVVENNNPVCQCDIGYHSENLTCVDTNECLSALISCEEGYECENIEGGFECIDINECIANTDNCSENADCTNTNGDFTCTCKEGYTGNGVTCSVTTLCGNGELNGDEECDGSHFLFDCDDNLAGSRGTVTCNNDCTTNFSACIAPTCGDNIINQANEDCDGTNIIFTCDDHQAGSTGTVSCNADCSLNFSQCSVVNNCGNGELNGDEECDGSHFLFDCDDNQSGSTGVVTCNTDCTINFSACVAPICGDGIRNQEDEECDGTQFLFDCNDNSAGSTGVVTCNTDCTINFSQCSVAETPIGWCSTQWPLTLTVETGVDTQFIYGRIWTDGVTGLAGEPVGITAQICYTTDLTLTTGVVCTDAIWSQQVEGTENDEFAGWLNFNASGTYYYYYQFSGNNGTTWYPCDINITDSPTDNGTAYHTGETFQGVIGTATVTNGTAENCSDEIDNDGDLAVDCADSNCISDDNCVDLFISEYIEGSGNNKAIEIYNPKSVAVSLSDYSIKYHVNSAVASTTVLLSECTTSIPSHGTIVIYNSSSVVGITSKGTCTSGTIAGFNGDDTLELVKISSNETIDLFGNIGTDPGTAWSVAGITNGTAEHTLVRKSSIKKGNPVNLASFGTDINNSEWTVYNQDDFTFLGLHTAE